MSKCIAVLGTGSWRADTRQWWHAGSAFNAFLATQGIEPAKPDDPFIWSGDLQGVPVIGAGKDWEAGAWSLRRYVEPLPYWDRNIVAHSHGGNVALLAAAGGLKLRSLFLIATPVRKHIEEHVAPLAVRNVSAGRLLHITDRHWDTMGMLGALFDWRLSFRRHFLVPGMTSVRVKGIGHSRLLHDPRVFPKWIENGWLTILRPSTAGQPEGV